MEQKRYIVLGFDLGSDNIAYLRQQFPQFEFEVFSQSEMPTKEALLRAEVLLNYGDKSQIPFATSAKYIHTMAAGVDGYLEAIENNLGSDVLLTNGAGVYNVSVGEHVIALMLAATHGIKYSALGMAEGHWRKYPIIKDVSGSTVLLLGTGDIGSSVATTVKAMGAGSVLGYKLNPGLAKPPFDTFYTGTEGLDEALAQADFICICLPGSQYTNKLLDAQRFKAVKKGAVLVNIGRGTIVDTEAMMEALSSGVLAFAATDVTDPEPLPSDHALWQMDNVLITSHYAGSHASPKRHTEWFAQNLQAYVAGEPLPGAVNRQWKY